MKKYAVVLESDEFGADAVVFDTKGEAEAAQKRMRKKANTLTKQDGIIRRVYLEVEP